MKRVSRPTRIACRPTSTKAKPRLREPSSWMTVPATIGPALIASRASALVASDARFIPSTTRITPTTAVPIAYETAPTAIAISAICASGPPRARVARNRKASTKKIRSPPIAESSGPTR